MDTKLSAAEIKTLQAPETEQVKVILPLLLKEMVLKGWVEVRKGKRPTNVLLWVVLAVFALGLFAAHFALGAIASVIILVAFYASNQPKTLFSLTPEGEKQAFSFGPNSPLLVKALHGLAYSRPEEFNNCTNKEWRTFLSRQYPDNATFHKDFLLYSLEHKGLVKVKNQPIPVRTPAGDAALAKIQAEIELGYELPRLLREGSPKAAVLAASLGGLLLLVPDMEGYFHAVMNYNHLPDEGLEDARRNQNKQPDSGSSDGGSSSPDEKQEENPDSDNGMDWDSNSDFLDGTLGDGTDSGIGTDSGCGVGADSSDSGGDGGDGGGDGGCGGGCGGGD